MFKFLRKKNAPKDTPSNIQEHPISEMSETELPNRSSLVHSYVRDTTQTLRGPKLRFVEDLISNLNLIRYFVPTDELVTETYLVGTSAKKHVVLAYLKDTANPGLIREIKNRIKAIRTRTVFDSSYIQRNIEDTAVSPFPQVEATERPDTVQSALWQGRVAIITEGSPNVLLAPCTFFELIDTPDDAYTRWFFAASFFKVARYIMLLIALTLSGFYIALLSFNPELLPTRLLLLIINSREGTPYPVYFEAFLMMGVAEAVRMMMIRIPSQVGSTVALFSGIALVIAGLFSHLIGPVVVMISTLTVIASFGIPDFDLRSAIRIFQFFTMIMSSLFGLFGFAASFFIICTHLVTLKSFGIAYMAPLAPIEASGISHTILRENTEEMPIDETFKPGKTLRSSEND